MYTRILILVLLVFIAIPNVFAQNYQVELPQLLPASPEPTNFVKAGVGNANLSTGAATASIPLYTIKLRDFAFPISLSYSTQGLKADEASSRVGYGWVLNANGMITRSVRGEPDEYALRKGPRTDYFTNSDLLYNYYQGSSTYGSGIDTQPDEFQFSFNGYSGKFVLDSTYQARVTSTSNLKINVTIAVTPGSTAGVISSITITTPDGVRYLFGSNFEVTNSINIAKFNYYKNITRTAFFLDQIILPAGEFITFNYSQINTTFVTGTTQTAQFPTAGIDQCGGCAAFNTYTTSEDKVGYNTRLLNSITTSNGITINLTYEPRPDLSADKRLINFEVLGLKKYQFSYYDVSGSSSVTTGRFFLTKVSDITMAGAPDYLNLDYTLGYDRIDQVPLPITFSQDYLGFYNHSGRTYFIPPTKNSNNTMDFTYRNPSSTYSSIGTLTSIQYPTGGKEEFIYESNTMNKLIKRYTTATYPLSGSGTSSSSVLYSNNAVTVPKDQDVTLGSYADDANLGDGITADANVRTILVEVFEGTTAILSRSIFSYTPYNTTIHLLAGHTYKLNMTVYRNTEIGYCTITYDNSATDIYDPTNVNIPGVRLKQIKYTDPFKSSTYSKYYTYAKLNSLTISTGSALTVNFLSSAMSKYFCGQYGEYETQCNLEIYSSNSTGTVYGYAGSGSVIYYNTVIESDDPGFVNGGTEYTFFDNDDGTNKQLIKGDDIISYPGGQYPGLSGVVFKKSVFNKDKAIIQVEQSDYETLIDMANSSPSIYVRKKYEPWFGRQDRLDAFDVVRSDYANYWIRLKSQTTSGSAVLYQKTDYTYGTASNILPFKITTTDSKNNVMTTERLYPNTYGSIPGYLYGYQALAVKNILSPVVLESFYRGGTLLQQKQTYYIDLFSNGTIVVPAKVQIKESASATLHDKLIFTNYDNKGNPIQLQKVNDVPIVYLWDQAFTLPICEVKNASWDAVAYTSFESGSNEGNWTFTISAYNATPAKTGKYFHKLTPSTSVSKSLTVGKYRLEYFAKSPVTLSTTGITVSNSSSSAADANGWILYKQDLDVSANTTLSLSSSGSIDVDAVRLYPTAAQMTSYTYDPLIGVTSMMDANNVIAYYKYDALGRLIQTKDNKGQILKSFEYHYEKQ